MDRREAKAKLLTHVKKVLRDRTISPLDAKSLVKELKREQLFDYACRVLELVRAKPMPDAALSRYLAQQHAICTYKDQDQPTIDRLDAALSILKSVENLDATKDQETLGLVGSIYKQKWLVDGQKQHLETSFRFYYRGHSEGVVPPDNGYTGINAAFVLDLLADIESDTNPDDLTATSARQTQAARIRNEITTGLLPIASIKDGNTYWITATLGEAYFGLGDYANAIEWLKRATALQPDGWAREATARQLARIATIHERAALHALAASGGSSMVGSGTPPTPLAPFAVLQEFLGLPEEVIRGAFLGKVGLALSGGGFRASLYHIGVLARLAEQDILRQVECLSCVSGGSIIGAHYYLELRKLLESRADDKITCEDYVNLVQRVATDFLAGVRRNIRMRAIGSLSANIHTAFSSTYSTTYRLGELYESEIFSQVEDGEGKQPRFLDDLGIYPKDAPEGPNFHPRWDNWKRRAKVPALVLNATALNTGHLWEFTTSYFGEPASCINTKVDGNYRLRRMYYSEVPDGFKRLRLGYAVAASSCVPGLFEPLAFRDLYPGIVVELVDGGVHDNQGLVALNEQGCDAIIVSDASGQMSQEDAPPSSRLPVVSRSNSILQARLRDTQFQTLDTRTRSSIVRSSVVHLKQELAVEPRDWKGCDDPKQGAGNETTFTSYDIRRDVQRLLSGVRTDLDCFCDAEAYALMLSGYKMMDRQVDLNPQWQRLGRKKAAWDFEDIERAMREKNDRLARILAVAATLPFKAWRLVPVLKYSGIAVGVLALAGFVYAYVRWGPHTFDDVGRQLPEVLRDRGGDATVTLTVIAVVALIASVATRVLRVRNRISRCLFGIASTLLWPIMLFHVNVVDRLYRDYGRSTNFER